ncbi:hypothetical protein RND81_14G233400 [Saponaria officinalis]|uniref:BHLH domain-containing protein n=1 Tax=Saponaria officinalis TaxID=3572 RepID=A0AAW1GTN4_SAPOF
MHKQNQDESDEAFSWENLFNDNSNNSENSEDDKEKKKDEEVNKKGKMKEENVKKKNGGKKYGHGVHIVTERERRKKMRNMFSNLHSLLPQLPPKADKSTIVDEAISYVKTLQCTLKRLQKQKLDRLTITNNTMSTMNNVNNSNSNSNTPKINSIFEPSSSNIPVMIQTWMSSNVVLNICGNDVQFTVYAFKKPNLFIALCIILEKHKLDVIATHISSDIDRSIYIIHAHVDDGNYEQVRGLITLEDLCKHAAEEMMLCVSS